MEHTDKLIRISKEKWDSIYADYKGYDNTIDWIQDWKIFEEKTAEDVCNAADKLGKNIADFSDRQSGGGELFFDCL